MGEAKELHIFKEVDGEYELVEKRETPPMGLGDNRWVKLAEIISDCKAILVSGVGNKPLEIIGDKGIKVIEMSGMIAEGLHAIYKGKPLKTLKKRDAFACGTSCGGSAQGCL